jgi:predicted ATPase
MAEYARFYKSDLHMHSPLDKSWRDRATKICDADTDERKAEVADLYLRRCHAVELDVIAVVDHNFGRSPEAPFLNWLRLRNRPVADELGKEPLIIFPGFEIECRVGRGGHIVCLFEPSEHLQTVYDAAARLCGAARFDGNGDPTPSQAALERILREVQEERGGIVIAAHPDRDKGLLARETAENFWRREEFCRPDLYAMELPKKPSEITADSFLDAVVRNVHPDYWRDRPIGCVTVSDCKELEAIEADERNHIGWRHCWIRMSRPSVEGLRQAFLARESHIRFSEASPDAAYQHPTIAAATSHGGFLEIENLEFSPNLTCIVGGRGAGKSTLVDTLRAACGRLSQAGPEPIRDAVRERIEDTHGGAVTEVVTQADGINRRVRFTSAGGQAALTDQAGQPMAEDEVRTLFPARFFSQGEIDALAKDETCIQMLLDSFVEESLAEASGREQEMRDQIAQLDVEIARQRQKASRRTVLQRELDELVAKLDAVGEIQEQMAQWDAVSEADRRIDRAESISAGVAEGLENARCQVADSLADVRSLQREAANAPDGPSIASRRALSHIGFALTVVSGAMANAERALEQRVTGADSALSRLKERDWQPIVDAAAAARERTRNELAQAGVDIDRFDALSTELQEKVAQLEAVDEAERELHESLEERTDLVQDLHDTWKGATAIRQAKAADLEDRLSGIRAEVTHQRDGDAFYRRLDEMGIWQDKRRLSEADITEAIAAVGRMAEPELPLAEAFCRALGDLDDAASPLRTVWPNRDARQLEVLTRWFTPPTLEAIQMVSVPDVVRIMVVDEQGNERGELGRVSVGQRGYAVLNMLLAEGQGPLIVDTPEEGLDNEGIYDLLVPRLRQAKESRQIIVVTHNANIPVNADAELVVVLEAGAAEGDNTESHIRGADTDAPAIGALDRPEVVDAVVSIMEGSQDAFERRRAKYGY